MEGMPLLCQPDVLADSKRYTLLSRERGDLAALVRAFGEYTDTARRLDEDRAALEDAELRELVLEEIPQLEQRKAELEATKGSPSNSFFTHSKCIS